ncbi:MAG TPA: outer membrane beta-barrel protein [Terracidiphilus sp.]|nr:outer membrane beta-barrel protein [Terracidiphilus sp.]
MARPPSLVRPVLSFLSVLLLIFAVPAANAQFHSGDAFVGFSRTGTDTFYPTVGGLNGWEASVHFKLKPLLGIEGDFAHYGLGSNASVPRTTTVMAGPRITVPLGALSVFAHGLVGGEHSSNSGGFKISESAFSYAVGGGLDVPLAPFFAWRVQGDRISAPSLSPDGGTPARLATGIVLRF